jgi:hypothetical protein
MCRVVLLLLLARVNACLVQQWYCDELLEYKSRKRGLKPQQSSKDLGLERGMVFTPHFHSRTESASLSPTLSLSLFLLFLSGSVSHHACLSSPLSDDCRCLSRDNCPLAL